MNATTTASLPPSLLTPQCPVLDSNTYTVSDTGRRLVHSDTCLNPAAIIPDTEGTGKVCPQPPPPFPGPGPGPGPYTRAVVELRRCPPLQPLTPRPPHPTKNGSPPAVPMCLATTPLPNSS